MDQNKLEDHTSKEGEGLVLCVAQERARCASLNQYIDPNFWDGVQEFFFQLERDGLHEDPEGAKN